MSFQYFPTKGLCLVKTNKIQIEELKKALAQEKEMQIRESNDRPAYQKNGLFFKESKIKTVGKKYGLPVTLICQIIALVKNTKIC